MFIVNENGYIFEINDELDFVIDEKKLIKNGCFVSGDHNEANQEVMKRLSITEEEVAIPYQITYNRAQDGLVTICDRGSVSDIYENLEDYMIEYVE